MSFCTLGEVGFKVLAISTENYRMHHTGVCEFNILKYFPIVQLTGTYMNQLTLNWSNIFTAASLGLCLDQGLSRWEIFTLPV